MSLASTSRAQMAYIEEATPGITPAAGTPVKLRMTGEKLAYQISAESSKEIDATRQTGDRVHVGAVANGGLDIELSYREYDSFLEGLLGSTFSTTFGTDGVSAMTVSFDSAANTATDDGTDGFTGLVAGQWVRFHDGANAGLYRVATMTNDILTLDSDTPLGSTVAGVTTDVSSSRLSNGTAGLRTFSLEKYFSDVAQYFIYRGMSPSKLSLNLSSGALITGSLDFLGFNSARADATMLPGAAGASQPFGVTNAVTGVGKILYKNNVIANTYIKSATINIDAKLRGQTAIGNLGNVGIGQENFDIGGTLVMYLADGAIYDDAIANNDIAIEIPITDVAGNGYVFVFDNTKLDVPTVQAGGMGSDVELSVPFTAVAPNKSTDHMIHIDRVGVIRV